VLFFFSSEVIVCFVLISILILSYLLEPFIW
jgi:hypothetical protein